MKSSNMVILVCLGALFYFTGCAITSEDVETMRDKCENQGIVNPLRIYLSFPFEDDIKRIKINHSKNGIIIDSFDVYPKNNFISINKSFYTHDSYEFIIDGQKSYILNDVNTSLETHCTWQGCEYPCIIKDYKINGANPFSGGGGGIVLKKKGYKEVWEK
ncbi:MAG: hypothetical protein V2A75_01050 [Pseudomonadota bacterium]